MPHGHGLVPSYVIGLSPRSPTQLLRHTFALRSPQSSLRPDGRRCVAVPFSAPSITPDRSASTNVRFLNELSSNGVGAALWRSSRVASRSLRGRATWAEGPRRCTPHRCWWCGGAGYSRLLRPPQTQAGNLKAFVAAGGVVGAVERVLPSPCCGAAEAAVGDW